MPFNLGGPELIVILVIVLIVFGAGRLPNVMRDLGTGVREFKKAQNETDKPLAPPASAPHSPAAAQATLTSQQAQPAAAGETPTRPAETSARA
jgi:sec-independent protein translocase protein TatA